MQFVWKIIIFTVFTSLTACIGENSEEPSSPPPNQDGNSVVAVDSDNDGVEDALDCAPQDANHWQNLHYQFKDQDQDGYVIPFSQNQQICTGSQLPLGYLTSSIGKTVGDCDDSLETGQYVYQNLSLYRDHDKDQIGAGSAALHCIGAQIPKGFSVVGTDCNDSDQYAYQKLAFTFRDEDQDSYLVALPQPQTVCTGLHLPNTYLSNAQGKWVGDCDDNPITGANVYQTVTLFSDKDGDHLGSGNGQSVCMGDTAPSQYSLQSGDCNDEDSSQYQELSFLYKDMDLDDHIVQLSQADKICTGKNLPSRYLATTIGKSLGDCNDDPITGSEVYRSVGLFTDEDGDSYGAGPIQQLCIGATLPRHFSNNANDCDDSPVTGANIYRSVNLFSDADGDSFGSGSEQNLCIGAALPNNFSSVPGDCNDEDENLFQSLPYHYRDTDLDGYLEQTSQAEQVCSGDTLPNGYFLTAQDQVVGDCNDNDDQIFQNLPYEYLDLDQDDHIVQLPISSLVCSGETLRNTHLISAQDKSIGDCDDSHESGQEIYRNLDLFTDADGDNYGAGQSHSLCIGDNIPQHYTEDGTDCDDEPQTGKFIYRDIKLYTNLDGDAYGTGSGKSYCIGGQIPQGLASLPNDCDDSDKQKFLELEYQYRDADGDNHIVQLPKINKVCTSLFLPLGYSAVVGDQLIGDCNDSIESGSQVYRSVELFTDEDGDNVGAGEGDFQCIGEAVPNLFSSSDSDCNDSDVNLYQILQVYKDSDGDNFGTGDGEHICIGQIAPIGYALNKLDCNDNNKNAWQTLTANYQDLDGDGYLSEMAAPASMCAGEDLPFNYSEEKPWRLDCNDDIETGSNIFQRLALFEDLDEDGYGNSKNPLSVQCLGRTLPPKFSPYAGDIDDQDPNVIEDEGMTEDELNIILSF